LFSRMIFAIEIPFRFNFPRQRECLSVQSCYTIARFTSGRYYLYQS